MKNWIRSEICASWSVIPSKKIRRSPGKKAGIIKDGYQAEVDKLRNAKSDGKDWLAKLETEEREKTGIKNLRIKY